MLSLVVIDDEYYLRMGISQIIDWEEIGISIVGEASNGEDGLALIKQLKPDIALLDIQMPIMNGLLMMEHLKKSGLSTKVIILSGYSDFEYAQDALHNGAADYLLKPLAPEKLLESLCKVKNLIAKEQSDKQQKEKLTQEIPGIKQQLLRRLIAGTVTVSEVNTISKVLELPSNSSNRIAISVSMDCPQIAQLRYPSEQLHKILAAYEDAIQKYLMGFDSYKGTMAKILSGQWCILLTPQLSSDKISPAFESIYVCCHELLRASAEISDLPLSIGISNPFSDLHDIGRAFKAAVSSTRPKFIPGISSVSSCLKTWEDEYRQEILDIVHYIRANHASDITVSSASAALFISPRHIMHLMKTELGLTFNTCVTLFRIAAALDLLEVDGHGIPEIARLVGYKDVKYFNEIFYRHTGIRSSDYRNWIQNKK